MALFTTADRDAVKTALVTAATEGVASVVIGSHQVTTYTLEQLYKLLAMIQQDLASGNNRGGLRMIKTVPPEAG